MISNTNPSIATGIDTLGISSIIYFQINYLISIFG